MVMNLTSFTQKYSSFTELNKQFFLQPHQITSWFCYITYWTFLLPIRRAKLAIEIEVLSKNQTHCLMSWCTAHFSWCPAYHFTLWNARHFMLNIFKNIIHNQISILIQDNNSSILFSHFIQSICILKNHFSIFPVKKPRVKSHGPSG